MDSQSRLRLPEPEGDLFQFTNCSTTMIMFYNNGNAHRIISTTCFLHFWLHKKLMLQEIFLLSKILIEINNVTT